MSVTDSTSSVPAGLPQMLRPLFWDCDFAQLDGKVHQDFVIDRVLSSGGWEAICWIRRTLGDDVLRMWMERHQGRSLSPQQLRFWELVLDLPGGLVDEWLQSEERRLWEGRIRR